MVAKGVAAAGGGLLNLNDWSFRAGVSILLLSTSLCAQKTGSHVAVEPAGIARAESAMDQQRWSDAEAILRKILAGNAKDAQAWFDLGYVTHAQQNYPEAISAYRGAVAAQPNSFECNLNLGMVLAHEHHPDASKFLEMATHLKPSGAHPQESLAHAWAALAQVQESHDLKTAVESWAHAIALAPDDAEDHLLFGGALQQSGDLVAAEREFRKAGELQPNSAGAMVALSNLFVRTKRFAEAEETLRRVVTTTPDNENGHLQLGQVLSAEKKDSEAAEELHKALSLRPDDWESLRELAFVQERNKQYSAAETSYRSLLAHIPNDAELHNGLGSVLLPQLKYAEAQNEFITSLRLRPNWGEAYGQLALAASGNKDYELAIKALDARAKLLQELPSSYFLRATCYDHLRRFTEAVENYKAFLAVSEGKFPDEEWKARHRLIAIEPEAKRKK